MKYCSTNNSQIRVSFSEAVRKGIPDDGGLFAPLTWPLLPRNVLDGLSTMAFHELSCEAARPFVEPDLSGSDLRRIVEDAVAFDAPLQRLDGGVSVLELFHGPTLAFKDFGARFMARTLAFLVRNESRELTVLVATSGDTGSAVASGFHNVPGISVVLLFPSGRVSPTQERQLTAFQGNVTAIEIDGTFDDCQRLVKEAFADRELVSRRPLTSANSINVARLLPQMFYYFRAYGQLGRGRGNVVFSVPSGNLGNLTAGLIAWKMGLPAAGFIAAANANAVVPHYLETGIYTPAPSVATLSNAMDVGKPSNLARIMGMFGGDVTALRAILASSSTSDDETRTTIRRVYDRYGYMLDPHGAVAFHALELYRAGTNAPDHAVVLETAHPAKFREVYDPSMREKIEMPERLVALLHGKGHAVKLSATYDDFRMFLIEGQSG